MTTEERAPAPIPAQAPLLITPFDVAGQFMGLKEIPGGLHNPAVVAMLQLDAKWVKDDETPWCSAFVNAVCFLLGLPRSRSLAARSWLSVGETVPLAHALVGFDVVVLTRGSNPASGHVGFYAGHTPNVVHLLGGNQGNAVTIQSFSVSRLLSVRRLRPTGRRLTDRPA